MTDSSLTTEKVNSKTEIRTIVDYFLGLVFLCISGLMIANVIAHDMWRDELQAWVIARDAPSVFDLLTRLGFEGFPPLWHLLLKGIQLFTDEPSAMQGVHVFIAILNLFLIWRFLPVHPVLKFLLMTSLPIAYQYAVFSRCYGISVTPLLVALIAHARGMTGLYWVMLGLGGQSTILGLCASCGLALHRLIENPKQVWAERKFVSVFVALVLFALAVAAPNAERLTIGDIGAHPTFFGFFQLFCIMPFSFLEIAQQAVFFWPFVFFVAAALYFIAFDFKPRVLAALAGMLGAFVVINQCGYTLLPYHMMMALIGALFLAIQSGALEKRHALIAATLLWGWFSWGGINALLMGEQIPYSQGKQAAAWIQKNGLAQADWVAVPDFAGTTVAGYLKRKFYFTQCQCESAAPEWSKKNRKIRPLKDEIAEINELMKRTGEKEVWILLGTVWPVADYVLAPPEGMTLERVATFLGATMPDEQYLIYRARRG